MKVGLIVEGDSDKYFFDSFFKKEFELNSSDFIVFTSGKKKGQCNILQTKTIHKHIKTLFEDRECTHVFILIDLNTQLDNQQQFDCVVLLRDWYKGKVRLKKFKDTYSNLKVVSVSKEIESWMLSAWDYSDNKYKKDLVKKFESRKKLNEKDLVNRFKALEIPLNRSKNKSLKYFLDQLGL
jgi:hypothetical protein